jgi:hypothetical protein
MGSQTPELQQLVLLQFLSKLNMVEVVEAVNRITQGLVVLFFNQEFIVGAVNGLDVELKEILGCVMSSF